MFKLNLDLSPNKVLIIFGVVIMLACLISNMNIIFKSIGFVISIGIILFGALIDSPLLEKYGDKPPEKITMKDDKPYPFQK